MSSTHQNPSTNTDTPDLVHEGNVANGDRLMSIQAHDGTTYWFAERTRTTLEIRDVDGPDGEGVPSEVVAGVVYEDLPCEVRRTVKVEGVSGSTAELYVVGCDTMSTEQDTESELSNRAGSDCVDEYLDQIRGTWSDDDPDTLTFGYGSDPVIADVDGDLRVLSSNLIHPRQIGREAVIEAINKGGEPRVEPLSAHTNRFDRPDFEDLPEEQEADS